jgi:predicted ATPase
MTKSIPAVPFVTRLQAEGFRSVAECDVSFGPITVLIGPNASGKSNILDILAFIRDCLTERTSKAVNGRGGPDELFHRNGGNIEERLRVEVHAALVSRPSDSEPIKSRAEYGFELIRNPRDGHWPVAVSSEWCRISDGRNGNAVGFQRDADGVVTNLAGGRTAGPVISPDLWLNNAAATDELLTGLLMALQNMSFYGLDPVQMAQPQPRTTGLALAQSGANLGEVLGILAGEHPKTKKRVDDYLAAIVPGALGIDELPLDTYSSVQLRMRDPKSGGIITFGGGQLSHGTLNAAGLLAALFQPNSLDRFTPLVCIDEPELGLHPSAAGVVFDALTEASGHVQVIAATQSGDLLDRDEFDANWVRVVALRDGATVVGPIDDASRRILAEGLATPGALMRTDQLSPGVPEDE